MKIVYDHQAFNIQSVGGVSRYFCEIAARIPSLGGDEVEVLAPLHINEHLDASPSVRVRGFRVPAIAGTHRIRRSMAAALARAATRRRVDVDIFHETYYSKADDAPASARRIVTVFDMIHEKFLSGQPGSRDLIEAKADAVRRADHVVCISENSRRDLIELNDVDARKTSVVHLGFSLMPGPPPTSPARPLAQPYLLYVGSRLGYKNFDGLLKAISGSATLKDGFLLACFGGGRFSGDELALIDSLGLGRDRVLQCSGSDALLAAMYTGASALVYPSLYEGFGIPPLEAMSFDCPVICSNTSSIPEVVGQAAALFDPTDTDEMQARIEQVVTSPALVNQLVAAGRERIKLFSWDTCARETLETYRHVLGR